MRQLRERFRPRSLVPASVAEDSSRQTGSAGSNTLASIIKALDVAEKAVDGLLIYLRAQGSYIYHSCPPSVREGEGRGLMI